MAVNLSVSVGVSKYSPGLQPLPGAVRAAEDFASWARRAGYHSILITDSGKPLVTIQRIKYKMESFLSKTEVKRLIFFFAGHGTAVAAANDCWLLSNVLREPDEKIDRTMFLRQLETYRIPQIALFVDACRTITNISFNGDGRGVLSNGGAHRVTPQLDVFLACSLGDPALCVQGEVSSQDRCLFTRVVLEGLSGNAEMAIERLYHPQAPAVVSHTLANFVEAEAENRASLLNRINHPEIQAAFRAPEDVYLKIEEDRATIGSHPPAVRPNAPIFPAPAIDQDDRRGLERMRIQFDERAAQDALDHVLPDFLRWIDPRRKNDYQQNCGT